MKFISDNIRNINEILKKQSVVTIGFFDGFHQGHKDILDLTHKLAKENDLNFVVITFDKKISSYLKNENDAIIDTESKKDFLEKNYFVDYLIELKVDDELINMNPESFMYWLEKEIKTLYIVEGKDFKFGAQGVGNIKLLKKEFGNERVIVQKRIKKYSTSKIKQYIKAGKISKANKLLGTDMILKTEVESSTHEMYKIVYPHLKFKAGYYEAILNQQFKSIIIINKKNMIGISKVDNETNVLIKNVVLVKYLGEKL